MNNSQLFSQIHQSHYSIYYFTQASIVIKDT